MEEVLNMMVTLDFHCWGFEANIRKMVASKLQRAEGGARREGKVESRSNLRQ